MAPTAILSLRIGGKAPLPAKEGAKRSVVNMNNGPAAAAVAPNAQSPGRAYRKARRQCLSESQLVHHLRNLRRAISPASCLGNIRVCVNDLQLLAFNIAYSNSRTYWIVGVYSLWRHLCLRVVRHPASTRASKPFNITLSVSIEVHACGARFAMLESLPRKADHVEAVLSQAPERYSSESGNDVSCRLNASRSWARQYLRTRYKIQYLLVNRGRCNRIEVTTCFQPTILRYTITKQPNTTTAISPSTTTKSSHGGRPSHEQDSRRSAGGG